MAVLTFEPLPDFEGEKVSPHPDATAWRKACSECLFRRHDPQDVGAQYQDHIAAGTDSLHFYCVHRKDDGHERVCACYAAYRRAAQHRKRSPA